MSQVKSLHLPPAPHVKRALAIAVDVLSTLILALAATFAMAVLSRSPQPIGPGAAFVVLFAAALFVHVFVPLRWQATIGMRLCGLKIVAEEDGVPSPQQMGLRGVVASITLVGLIPIPFQIISCLTDPDHRSNSDWISGTRVVVDLDRLP